VDRDLNEQMKELAKRFVLTSETRSYTPLSMTSGDGSIELQFQIPSGNVLSGWTRSLHCKLRHKARCLVFEVRNILLSIDDRYILSDHFYNINNITKEEKELLLIMEPQLHKILTNIGIL